MRFKFTGLWRHSDFLKLWSGQTISVFGSQVTFLALPLTAVVILKASPLEMGILEAAGFLPFLVLSLFVGVWVDRLRRRPILIIADFSRFVLLGSIPVMYLLNSLTIYYLCGISLLVGIMTVFFEITYQSYLPVLVDREQLVEGNGKLQVSESVAQVAGPGLVGILIQFISAPFAIVLDSLSFLASALFLTAIKKAELVPMRPAEAKSMWAEIGEGLQVVLRHPIIRTLAICTSGGNFFSTLVGSLYTLYVINELKLSTSALGLIFAIGGVGALLGAALSGWAARRFGIGRTIVGTLIICGIAPGIVPLVTGNSLMAFGLLTISNFIYNLCGPIYYVTQISLRQAIVPERLQGRVNASTRFISWGLIPVGALVGGVLGQIFGLRIAIFIGTIGSFLSYSFVIFSPVRTLPEPPVPIRD